MKKSQYVVIQHERQLTEVDLNPNYRPCHIATPANATLGKIFFGMSEGDAIKKWREANKPPPPPAPQAPKPTPQSCASALPIDKWPKGLSNAAAIAADAGDLADLVTPNNLHFSPLQVLDPLGFASDDDLVETLLPGYGPQIKKFSVLKDDLNRGVFSKMAPNVFEMDREPPRRWLVLRFPSGVNLQAQGKRIAYLRRFGHLAALVLDSQQLALEAWFFVGDLSKGKLERLAKTAVEIGADPRCLLKNWRACVPGSPCISGQSVYLTLRDLKLVKDADHLGRIGMRSFCLFFDPPASKK